MGADGGVCWVKVTGDSARFMSLVEPLGFSTWHTWQEDKHNDWLEANYDYHAGCAVATYGTSQEVQGYLDLETVLGELFSWDDEHIDGYGDNFTELTFEEVFLAIETRPTHWWDYKTRFEEVLTHSIGFWYRRDEVPKLILDRYTLLLPMNVLDWAKEVRDLINMGSFCSEETWT